MRNPANAAARTIETIVFRLETCRRLGLVMDVPPNVVSLSEPPGERPEIFLLII